MLSQRIRKTTPPINNKPNSIVGKLSQNSSNKSFNILQAKLRINNPIMISEIIAIIII